MRRSTRIAGALAASACVLGIAAPAASAASVGLLGGDTLRLFANPGETNVVTVDRSGDNYIFTDNGAPLTPTVGCVAVNANSASCAAAGITSLAIELGDLNDSGTIGAGVTGSHLNVFMDGGENNDILTAGQSVDSTISGGDGNDALVGGPKRDRLIGNDGNDTLNGGDGGDDLDPGDGNDVANGGPGDDDRVSASSEPDGADVLSGGPGIFDSLDFRRDTAVTLTANGASDDGANCPGASCEGDNFVGDFERIDTGDGNDVISAGPLDNVVFAGGGDDQVHGEAGNDDLEGDDGQDVLSGDRGNDRVSGDRGPDQLLGGAGDDLLNADSFETSPDVFSGGKGLDQVDYSGASDDLKIDLDNKADDGIAGEGDNVRSDVEDVIGGDGNDRIAGSARANELEGGLGSDLLTGGKGADGLHGDSGADKLIGGKAADLLEGGAGPDRLLARDGGRDEARCGSAIDRLKADSADRYGPDCDKVAVKGRRA